MSLTQFSCQYCGRTQSVPSSRNGQSVLCRNCGGDNVVPGTPPPPTPQPQAGPQAGQAFGSPVGARNAPPVHQAEAEHTTCPYCGEVIKAAAIKCRHCGERLGSARQPQMHGGPRHGNMGAADRFGPGMGGGHGMGFHPDLQSAANSALVFSIVAVFFCGGLLAPFVLMKVNEVKQMAYQRQAMVPTQVVVAQVFAWIGILWLGFTVLMCGFGMLAA